MVKLGLNDMEYDVILVDHDYVTNTGENQNVNECSSVINISDFNFFSNNEEVSKIINNKI